MKLLPLPSSSSVVRPALAPQKAGIVPSRSMPTLIKMARTLGHGHPVSSLIIRNPVSSQPVAALISHDSLSLSAQETPRATSSRRWTKRKKFKTWQRSGENSGQQTVSPLTLHHICIQIMPSLSFNIGWNCDFLHFFGFHFDCKLGDFGGHERGDLNFLRRGTTERVDLNLFPFGVSGYTGQLDREQSAAAGPRLQEAQKVIPGKWGEWTK